VGGGFFVLRPGPDPFACYSVGDPWAYAWSLNGQRRDLVQEQRYLIWKFCHENSAAWQTEKQRIADEANRKRSEAQAGVPKAEAKERARTECPKTFEEPAKEAKATASKTNPGAVARGDLLAKEVGVGKRTLDAGPLLQSTEEGGA
jgi:hypothetical protein